MCIRVCFALLRAPLTRAKRLKETDTLRLLAFLIAFIGFPLFADAQQTPSPRSSQAQTASGQSFRDFIAGKLPAVTNDVRRPAADPMTVMINDCDSSIIYSTLGAESTGPTWFIGTTNNSTPTERFSNFGTIPAFQIYGADAVVNFSGTGITWIGKIGPWFGIASYSVDGGAPVTFDAFNASLPVLNNNVVVSGLAPGSHSLKIEVTQFNNPSSSDYYQTIDAFNITGVPLPLYQGTVAGWDSPELSFSGTGWTCGPALDGTDLSGGHCYSFDAGASIAWTFTGSLIEVYGRPDAENGIFVVLIDGTMVAQVDEHFGSVDNDALNGYGLFQAKVAPGTHTIQLVNTGNTTSSISGGTAIQIDMFVAFP